jgi:hypothetical protein
VERVIQVFDSFAAAEAEDLEQWLSLSGRSESFLSLADLMASKLAAGRAQDLVDVQKLRVIAERTARADHG